MSGAWDELVLAICRPPRDAYTPADLVGGPTGRFNANGRAYTREDFAVRNPRGHLLQLSLYEPAGLVTSSSSPDRGWGGSDGASRLGGSPDRAAAATPTPVVVYCHCNSGSRRDAEEVLHLLLPRGLAVLAMDFSGSGVSEGEYVTLGAHEVDDLTAAIGALRARRGGARLAVALWGRSMGAAAALLYAARDPRVAALVLDSPFASLPDLLVDLVAARRLPVPRALTRAALALMRRSVARRAGFDVGAVQPAAAAPGCFAPALFGAAPGDAFIPIAHTRRLVAAYAGDAACVEFEGDHNTVRPAGWYASGLAFLGAVLLGEGSGRGRAGPGAAAVAAATAATSSSSSSIPRPFAARGGRLPVADPADLAAAAAFEGSVARAGAAPGGHAYGGAALAAAHAGSEAASAANRRGDGAAGLTPADLFPPALVGGGRSPAQAEAAMLAAALADSLAVSGGERRRGGGGGGGGARRTPSPQRGRPRDPGEACWLPAGGPGAAASPAPSTAAATASGTPSPVRSHFVVPPAARPSPGGGGGGGAGGGDRPTPSPGAFWPTPPSAAKPPSAARPSPGPALTPDQARLASFFGKTPTPPHGHGGGGGGGHARSVVPIEATSPSAVGAAGGRAARYAAGAGAEAARAARTGRRSSQGGGPHPPTTL